MQGSRAEADPLIQHRAAFINPSACSRLLLTWKKKCVEISIYTASEQPWSFEDAVPLRF